jgi:hypothetical protein
MLDILWEIKLTGLIVFPILLLLGGVIIYLNAKHISENKK